MKVLNTRNRALKDGEDIKFCVVCFASPNDVSMKSCGSQGFGKREGWVRGSIGFLGRDTIVYDVKSHSSPRVNSNINHGLDLIVTC